MEEKKQLSTQEDGRCEDILHSADEGKTTIRAFLKSFVEVVELNDNKAYVNQVFHDLQLALMERGEMELARLTGKMELELRRASAAAAKHPQPQLYIGAVNGQLSAYYDNEEVNVVQGEIKN